MFAEFSGRCLAFDEAAAAHYCRLAAARSRAGRPITVEDAQIAAIAQASGMVLATRNKGDLGGIDGLVLVDPFAGADA